MATIKLAMWQVWKRDYIDALDDVKEFMDKHPKDPLMPKAREVALQAFATLSADVVSEERYAHMRETWENYPTVHMQAAELSSESRIPLGVTFWQEA